MEEFYTLTIPVVAESDACFWVLVPHRIEGEVKVKLRYLAPSAGIAEIAKH